MKKLYLDIKQSKEVYKQCKEHIKPKHCYNNIFEAVTMYMTNFRFKNKWKVCYGYVECMPLLYCRHCFILDEHENVIDPTLYAHTEPPTQRGYYVMAVFDDVDEYLSAIEHENYMPALDKYFREQDKQARQWANENGIIFIS